MPSIKTPNQISCNFEVLKIIDVDAHPLFHFHPEDLDYCQQSAPFKHEAVCEFMIYLGDEEDSFNEFIEEIKEFISEDLTAILRMAKKRGATWLMLHDAG